MDVLQEWDIAANKARAALARMIEHKGKSGHEVALKDYRSSREALDEVTRRFLGEQDI